MQKPRGKEEPGDRQRVFMIGPQGKGGDGWQELRLKRRCPCYICLAGFYAEGNEGIWGLLLGG